MNETISRIELSSYSRTMAEESIRKIIWLQNVLFSFIIVMCKHVHIFFAITCYHDVLLRWLPVFFINIDILATLPI